MEDIYQNTTYDFLLISRTKDDFSALYFLTLWEFSIIKMHYFYNHKTFFLTFCVGICG